jgi:hypothetical protein
MGWAWPKTVAVAAGLVMVALTASATAEVAHKGRPRVSFEGGMDPQALPCQGHAAVAVTISGHLTTTDGSFHQIQPASTKEAIEACRRWLVGHGEYRANVVLPEQSSFVRGRQGRDRDADAQLQGERFLRWRS